MKSEGVLARGLRTVIGPGGPPYLKASILLRARPMSSRRPRPHDVTSLVILTTLNQGIAVFRIRDPSAGSKGRSASPSGVAFDSESAERVELLAATTAREGLGRVYDLLSPEINDRSSYEIICPDELFAETCSTLRGDFVGRVGGFSDESHKLSERELEDALKRIDSLRSGQVVKKFSYHNGSVFARDPRTTSEGAPFSLTLFLIAVLVALVAVALFRGGPRSETFDLAGALESTGLPFYAAKKLASRIEVHREKESLPTTHPDRFAYSFVLLSMPGARAVNSTALEEVICRYYDQSNYRHSCGRIELKNELTHEESNALLFNGFSSYSPAIVSIPGPSAEGSKFPGFVDMLTSACDVTLNRISSLKTQEVVSTASGIFVLHLKSSTMPDMKEPPSLLMRDILRTGGWPDRNIARAGIPLVLFGPEVASVPVAWGPVSCKVENPSAEKSEQRCLLPRRL